ncbi:MAG: acetyltransferase [Alphaproteobacteria bacterium]|nr:acetyltransferase [Alphaproteobacteria bacterium]
MKNLIIIGASALGREVASWAKDANPNLVVKGFLDSRADILDEYDDYPSIVSDVENYVIQPDDVFICCLGEPYVRKKYIDIIKNKGGSFVSLIHPSAFLGKNTTIGIGTIIQPRVVITSDVQIGNYCVIGINSTISHDSVIKNFVTVSPGCDVAGWCHLYDFTFMGIHSCLIPHVVLGQTEGVFVAAGAVVTKSFSAGRIMGVPAKNK